MQLRSYETVFVLTPVLTKEQVEGTIQKFRSLLVEKGAHIVYEGAMGLQRLAYPIRHHNTGIYQLINFQSDPNVISELETAYKRDETVIRFLTCVLDKYGVEYNHKKRQGTLHHIDVNNAEASKKDVEPEFELNQEQIA